MTEEIDVESEVILEIENTGIKCKKNDLMKHSDYFKVMFEGNFVESTKKVVQLQGISLKAMNMILRLLWDRSMVISEEDILSVLPASCMLQFIDIKEMCIEKLIHLLRPTNCIKIWLFAEQLDIKHLYLKAKSMALIEYDNIKDLDCILELEFKQLRFYLGNTHLQCRSELDVLQTCMKWWYENCEKETNNEELRQLSKTDALMTLLACLDFNNLSCSDIQEIMSYPDLSTNNDIKNILQCIIGFKKGIKIQYDDHIISKAKIFSKSKTRSYKQSPCILVGSISDEHARKKLKLSSSEKDVPVVFYDNFKRKRYYTNIESSESSVAIVYYDDVKNDLVKLLTIAKQKCGNLDGFKIVGYKEFIFVFGGEFLIGKGNWNKNFWVYNTIRECWERKSVMPFVRRHFESCICDGYLYIVGGTGNFRVIQDNVFWYNYKEDKWSTQIMLPCSGRQIRCCCWNGQLVLLNMNNQCSYVFNQHNSLWCKYEIHDEKQLVPILPDKYSAFVYKDSIFIKSNHLIEMKMENQKLVIVSCISLDSVNCDHIESVICGDILYTLYKQTCPDEETSTITFEKYCMISHTREFILKDVYEGTLVELEGDQYVFRTLTNLFGFQHYALVDSDVFVNDL